MARVSIRPRVSWIFLPFVRNWAIDKLKISMVGDLRYGRTVHSLTRLLMQYDVSYRFVSPEILRLPMALMNELIDREDEGARDPRRGRCH